MAKRTRGSVNSATGVPQRQPGVLASLQPEEAAQVLHRLISLHPDLRAQAEEIAGTLLRMVSFEDVADEVENAVGHLDEDTLYEHAGAHSWGYVEPGEAAGGMLEQALEPAVENMKRYLGLGLEEEALEICKGIVLGLYRVGEQSDDAVLGCAPEFPGEAAGRAVSDWLSGGGPKSVGEKRTRARRVFPSDFIIKQVPKWREWLERVARGNKP